MSSSSSSSTSTSVTLTASQYTQFRGDVQLPEDQNLERILEIQQEIEDVQEQFDRIYQEQWQNYTPEEAHDRIELYNSYYHRINRLAREAESLGANWTTGHPLDAPIEIDLNLSSNPSNLTGEVELISETVWAYSTNSPSSSMGTLSDNTGTTNFSAKFQLNGNYGMAIFKGKAGDIESQPVTIVVSGATYEYARAKADAYKAEIQGNYNRLISRLRNTAAWAEKTAIALATIAMGLLSAVVTFKIGVILGILAFLVGAMAATLRLIASAIERKMTHLLQEFEDNIRPILDSMPRTSPSE